MLMVAQLDEYTENQWIVHFKKMNIWYVNYVLKQGSPTSTGAWPDRNQAAQQEVSNERASEALSVCAAAPQC